MEPDELRTVVLEDRAMTDPDLGAARALVFTAFGGRFSEHDWDHSRGGWRVMLWDADNLVAHAAVVPRLLQVGERSFHAGYIEAVATEVSRHGQGLGSLVMTRAGDIVREQFELGGLSTGRPSFYARLGWERWLGPTYLRTGTARIRTPGEDDGLMVLRCGPSSGVDLRAPISCEGRPGDDW